MRRDLLNPIIYVTIRSKRVSTAFGAPDGEQAPVQPPGGQQAPVQPPGGEQAPVQPPGGEQAPVQPPGGEQAPVQPPGAEQAPVQPPGGEQAPVQPPVGSQGWYIIYFIWCSTIFEIVCDASQPIKITMWRRIAK